MENQLSSILPLVARSAGRGGYRNLYPFIFAGVEGMNAAFDPNVLRETDIDEFLYSPSRINEPSRCRTFFNKCLQARNPSALYIEGLRIGCQNGPIERAMILLEEAAAQLKIARFALSLFYICSGSKASAERTMAPLCRSHPNNPLYTVGEHAEAEEICNMIFMQIYALVPAESGRFRRTWSYLPRPRCLENNCGENCDCLFHCSMVCPCNKCFFYWNSFKLCEIC